MIYFGVDPGVEASAVAGIDDRNKLVVGAMFSTKMKNIAGVLDQSSKVAEFFQRLIVSKLAADQLTKTVVAIESQEIVYTAKAGKNPRSLILTASVSGIYALAFAQMRSPMYMPRPSDWKGQTPKHVHQARICEHMGWQHEKKGNADPYCVPSSRNPETYRMLSEICVTNGGYSCWKHLMDAVGLALWVKDKHTQDQFKRSILSDLNKKNK